MDLTQPIVAATAADCLPMLAIALACRLPGRWRLPLELRLLGALLGELAGWAGDEWSEWRATRAGRGRRC